MTFLKRLRISTKIFFTLASLRCAQSCLTTSSAPYEINDLAINTQHIIDHQAAALHLTGSAALGTHDTHAPARVPDE